MSEAGITLALTQGNLNNNHFYLRDHLDFFPADAVGAPNSKDGIGVPLRVHFAGSSEPVETDIAGGNKLFLRARAPIGEFFRRFAFGPGDEIAIERVGDREYRVVPRAGQASG
jgi:hypothetical protein